MRNIVLVLSIVTLAASPAAAESDPWKPFAFLIGEWRGDEKASFGKGRGQREYSFILGDRYLLSRNASTFEPQEGMPEGQRHEDWTIFSHDAGRETYVVRQFNSEGFVNTFTLHPDSEIPGRMVFVSEASENAPPGLRARLTYEKVSDDRLQETFELAMPGKDFAVMIRTLWRRAAD